MRAPDREGRLHLSKHHGAGNDFLVVLQDEDRPGVGADTARLLCDRHRGVGADGVIRVWPLGAGGGADLAMELRNADGGVAEMSGNGMRCLAQAAVDARLVAPPTFTVRTAAGVRTVEYRPSESPAEAWASVDMGAVTLGPEEPAPAGCGATRARRAAVGNPHLVVLVADPAAVDVAGRGTEIAAGYDGGCNVEFVAPRPAPGGTAALALRVCERGVGETLACGTGSVAAAEVCRAWGLVGDRVRVENPGGPLDVQLGPAAGDPARLGGPVHKVADVDVVVPRSP